MDLPRVGSCCEPPTGDVAEVLYTPSEDGCGLDNAWFELLSRTSEAVKLDCKHFRN